MVTEKFAKKDGAVTYTHIVETAVGTMKRVSKSRVYSHVVTIDLPTDAQVDAYYTARGYDVSKADDDTRQYWRSYWNAKRSRLAGWTSRLDLARKLVAQHPGFTCHIYDAATGEEVR